jgi:SpoVK/Ycf46/Vps4 family AAA+-type ATPase
VNLENSVQKVEPRQGLSDIVLPDDQMEQLEEIIEYVRQKEKVYGKWGFGNKLSRGKGLNILFSGPPGTGKTMAAEVIAKELLLDLYRIDLSQVVSKYIGETEKNLNRIFKEAETSNAILFFDEADALYGKRSEVKDAHDRYANVETAYLLQKMEEYEGITILCYKFKRKSGRGLYKKDGFFRWEFPFPEEEYRKKLWESVFPKELQ